MNSTTYHLTVFLSLLLAFVVLTITNHLPGPLVQGIIYGAMGLSGVNSGTSLLAFFKGPDAPSANKQAGFVSLRVCTFLFVACFPAAFIAACATGGTTTPAQAIATSCASGSAAIKVATQALDAGYLSTSEAASVKQALVVVTPLCTGPTPPTATDAESAAVNAAFAQLTAIESKYHAAASGP